MRIFVADDSADVRLALQMLLDAEPGMDVIGIADHTDGLVTQVYASKAEVLLLDCALPGEPQNDLLAELQTIDSAPKLIALSAQAHRTQRPSSSHSAPKLIALSVDCDEQSCMAALGAGRCLFLQNNIVRRIASSSAQMARQTTVRGFNALNIFSITDWFTTAARLGEAKENIPDDRVTDGVDQANLLIHGEGYSHRDYIFLYGGAELGAVRKRQFKTHAGEMHGGLPTNEVYDVVTDPGEKFVDNVRHFGLSVPFQDLVREHMTLIEKFPHRVLEDTPGAKHIEGD